MLFGHLWFHQSNQVTYFTMYNKTYTLSIFIGCNQLSIDLLWLPSSSWPNPWQIEFFCHVIYFDPNNFSF